MKRAFRPPPGIAREQAHAAALAVCARSAGRKEAEETLRCLGLILDPEISDAYLGDPQCHPMGRRDEP